MAVVNRLKGMALVLSMAVALAACGDNGSGSSGQAGSAGTAGSAGQGGAGGSTAGSAGSAGSMAGAGGSTAGAAGSGGTGVTMSLGDQGIAQNDCAPNDGSAIAVRVGAPSVCPPMLDAAKQAWFLAYPGDTKMLTAGQTWTFDGMASQLSITWLPNGAVEQGENVTQGTLAVVSADATQATFDYSFVTMAGVTYAGTVTVTLCDSTPLCG